MKDAFDNGRGIFTSEFWLTVAVLVASTILLLEGSIEAEDWKIVNAGATGAYAIGRSLAKR